jgi:ribosomal-protein-alanine N-acetyltransferase
MQIIFKPVDTMDQKNISSVLNIEKEAFGKGALVADVVVPLMRHGKVYTAVDEEDNAIACAYFLRDMSDISFAYLMSVAVLPRFRGHDIGIALIEYALSHLKRFGITRVQLTVDPANFSALAAYREKLGFTVSDTTSGEYGDEDERLVMTKEL